MTVAQTHNLRIVNSQLSSNQPFHVLSSSKLPILVAIAAGTFAFTFISKLHDYGIGSIRELSGWVSQVLEPIFYLGNLYHSSVNVTILYLMAILVCYM